MDAQSTASQTTSAQAASPLGNKPFAISFDGSVLTGTLAIRTVRDIDRLMRVLEAQKAAFEAMQEDHKDALHNDISALAQKAVSTPG